MGDLANAGFVLLPGLLTADEVETFAEHADRLAETPPAGACERPNNTLLPLRWDDPIVTGTLGAEHRLRRIERALAATDLRWISGYLSTKAPASPPLWWHQDWWCWDHPISFRRPAAQVAIACYLTDTTEANGALRVLPGSHLRSHPVHAVLPEAHSAESGALAGTHPAMSDQPGQLTLSVAAGDAVAMDYRLLHGTHANASGRRRDCVLLNVTPAWADLPAEVRAHLISHPALPGPTDGSAQAWLPAYDGPRRDLPLQRHAPASFGLG
jgi:Phytanoyl-CoA dioxygenase (PhyH)